MPGRFKSSTARREPPLRWLALALLAALSCNAVDSWTAQKANTLADHTKVYLIDLKDSGADTGNAGDTGRRIGCGDSVVPVEVSLVRPRRALDGALETLLEMSHDYDPASGFYNPLYASRLSIDRIDQVGPEVKVYLKGYLEIGGECDSPRVMAQLTETALQFPDVQRATFYLEGKPLAGLLSGQGR